MIFMKRIFVVLAVVLVLSFVLAGCGGGADSSESSEISASETQSLTQAVTADSSFTVKTDYATLRLPYKYVDAIVPKVSGDTVTLSSGNATLIDFYFNSDKGTKLGTFKSDKGEVTFSMKAYDVKDNKNHLAMQDDCLNSVLEGLKAEYSFATAK